MGLFKAFLYSLPTITKRFMKYILFSLVLFSMSFSRNFSLSAYDADAVSNHSNSGIPLAIFDVPNKLSSYSIELHKTDSFRSPSLMFTNDEIIHLRYAVENSTDGSSLNIAYNQLIENCENGLKYTPMVYQGNNPSEFYEQILKQAALARDLALGYFLSEKIEYAEKAVEIIGTWAEKGTGITYELTSGTGMLIARSMYPMLCAYDLLKNSTFIDNNAQEQVNLWLSGFVPQIKMSIDNWEQNDYYNRQDYQNHLVAHSMGLLALGYVLEDGDLVKYALESPENPRNIYDLITGCIFMEGDEVHHREPANAPPPESGEIYDRYRHHTATNRGLQYAHLTTTLLTISAKICANNGLNLFEYTATTGENLRLPHEYYADFYRLDACIKSGFYCGESHRIGKVGDDHGMFELGYRYYHDSEPLKNLLNSGSFNRGTCYMNILGYTRFYSAYIDYDDKSTCSGKTKNPTNDNSPIGIYPNPASHFLL